MDHHIFDGADYIPDRDNARLSTQYVAIFEYMQDGIGRTLGEIVDATGYPQASISAQLRHMRKKRFGGHSVLREYLGGGLYSYSLHLNMEVAS